MNELQSARVNTAGAYLCLQGLYVFTIGIQPHNGHIPVVRLGGHREDHETGWECAAREVYEECRLEIKPLVPHTTYLVDWDHIDAELQEIEWKQQSQQEPIPVLVVTHRREIGTHLSLMYMAEAHGIPVPSSEVKGLLLLTEEEIHFLWQTPPTLEEYQKRGGRAILRDTFDTRLVLEPFAQLRLLSRILSKKPEIKFTNEP